MRGGGWCKTFALINKLERLTQSFTFGSVKISALAVALT